MGGRCVHSAAPAQRVNVAPPTQCTQEGGGDMEQTGKTASMGFLLIWEKHEIYIQNVKDYNWLCFNYVTSFSFGCSFFWGGGSHDSPRLLVHGPFFVVFLFPLFLDLSGTSTETPLCTSPDHLSLASQTLQTSISKLYATENMFSTLPSYVPRKRMFGTFPGLFPPQGPHSLHHFKVNKKKEKVSILEVHTGPFPGGELSRLASPSIATAELRAVRLQAPFFI